MSETPLPVLLVWVLVVAALLTGTLLGFLVAHVRAGRRIEQLRVDLETAKVRLESETHMEDRLSATFDSLAGQTLRNNSEMFLRLASTQLVEPLRAALAKTETQVESLERERRDAFASLRTQIETLSAGHSLLQRETRNLVTALRRPEVRGRWGELTLRRLVELAGMSEHCDFTEQLHVVGDEGALRPDLVVHMPDSRDLVVDVKTPLDAYLAALEATTEEGRLQQLKRHAHHVETRVRQLASKNYWAQFEHSPEFAVLFLPGDQFLSAALAEKNDLLDSALKQNVIIATPSTLIALLKTVAYGWRQSAVAQNAAIIRELGQELYRRLGSFTGHLGRTGARLGAAVEAYNAAVGSLERQVLPQARRFSDLGVTGDSALAALDPVDALARVPAQGTVAGVDAGGTASVDAGGMAGGDAAPASGESAADAVRVSAAGADATRADAGVTRDGAAGASAGATRADAGGSARADSIAHADAGEDGNANGTDLSERNVGKS
jgi:DNA recombination protein RmuC